MSNTKPTVPGAYWAKFLNTERLNALVQIEEFDDGLFWTSACPLVSKGVDTDTWNRMDKLRDDLEWIGPLQEPRQAETVGEIFERKLRAQQLAEEKVKRYVVCAAIRYANRIICAPRHYDEVMRGQIDRDILLGWEKRSETEQGFVDQFGVFMDREEALKVATAAGQINTRRPKSGHPEQLFSEDLY